LGLEPDYGVYKLRLLKTTNKNFLKCGGNSFIEFSNSSEFMSSADTKSSSLLGIHNTEILKMTRISVKMANFFFDLDILVSENIYSNLISKGSF